jgi:hypothetical protein
MGMYTSLNLKLPVKPEFNSIWLDFQLESLNFPNYNFESKHPFFSMYRTVFFTEGKIVDGVLITKIEVKNYEGEIRQFLDWLKSFVSCSSNTAVGSIKCEDWDTACSIIWTGIDFETIEEIKNV